MDSRAARALAMLAPLAALACQPADAGESGARVPAETRAAPRAPVVEVTARDFAFQAPDTLAAGWTTFRMTNAGQQDHFMFLQRLPEGKTFHDYVSDVGSAFVRTMRARQAGLAKGAAVDTLVAALPQWYLAGMKPMGGVGMLAPGHSAQTTVRLEPGTYVMECYVKTPDGRFHSELGMERSFVVTPARAATAAPTATEAIALTNDSIRAPASLTSGTHTIAVRYLEQPPGGLGNDVHVVRLDADDELAALERWMDWLEVGALRAPAPAAFLGGVQEMPAGDTAYFTVSLTPGRYAWIAEAPVEQGKSVEFTVR